MSTDTSERFDPEAFLRSLPHEPGVYRMIDAQGAILYVGKAKDLARRVSQYFRSSGQGVRNRAMMARTARVEITVTGSEAEALLLENNLIKAHRPRYNVLLRDDKSYPYIYVATEHRFPRLAFHRGARDRPGRYFGPYSSAGAVRETLGQLQKLFRVRLCEDSTFANRTRPCLEYQIQRCSAPCVGAIDAERYRRDVEDAIRFLEGRSEEVIEALVARMEAAAARLEFELAARYRDQIEQLQRVAERQYVAGERGDVDVLACAVEGRMAVVQLGRIRQGVNLGTRAFHPRLPEPLPAAEVLEAFIGQYYLGREIPEELLVDPGPCDHEALAAMLSAQRGGDVRIVRAPRGRRARWLEMARRNATHALTARLAAEQGHRQRLEALRETLGLDRPLGRIECFDISHTAGEATVAACVVFDAEGPRKSDYRRFNIREAAPGDDYAAMEEVLRRRFRRWASEGTSPPDLLLIDGGPGQVARAVQVLREFGADEVCVLGIAKGEGRRPCYDHLVMPGRPEGIHLAPHSPALHLVQQVRDEAHRFAVTGHRQRRARARTRSPLEEIPGLGPKRRQRLLKHFGGLRGVTRAGVEDLSRVPGISRKLARDIYTALHS
ncbi:MAG TPA: excinuclease ABC subunit UvrC [Chromatiales bacterium]|nr:excinuclease ABC subunit UvrC [Chromatiales bacterium]